MPRRKPAPALEPDGLVSLDDLNDPSVLRDWLAGLEPDAVCGVARLPGQCPVAQCYRAHGWDVLMGGDFITPAQPDPAVEDVQAHRILEQFANAIDLAYGPFDLDDEGQRTPTPPLPVPAEAALAILDGLLAQ